MKHIEPFLNESLWNRRKYFIDRIEDENVEKYDYDNLKKDIIYHTKKFGRYRLSYFNSDSNRKDYYFDRLLKEYHESVVNLYRMFKLLTKDNEYPPKKYELPNDEWFNDIYKRLASKFHKVKFNSFEHNIKYMVNIEYFLNRINLDTSDNTKMKYYHTRTKSGYGYYYEFYNKVESEKEIEEHKDIDPFGEETW